MSQQTNFATWSIRMSALESRLLGQSLDDNVIDLKSETGYAILTARDKIADAYAVALWLRDEATVDLEPDELQACQDALGMTLDAACGDHEEEPRLRLLQGKLARGHLPLPVGCVMSSPSAPDRAIAHPITRS
jgi:hypothetical protein